jgi:hypothetical protein
MRVTSARTGRSDILVSFHRVANGESISRRVAIIAGRGAHAIARIADFRSPPGLPDAR